MAGSRRIVVVGAGPAGTMAALTAKKRDPASEVILLSDEASEPYEKPPLSKAVLVGTAAAADAPIAGPRGVASHGVVLQTDSRCIGVDAATHDIALANGARLSYDALVLATGSLLRELPSLPSHTPRVYYLRTERDAAALRTALHRGGHLLVIGGGLIGLEVAASAAQVGMRVTVLEVAPRLLSRVCDERTAAAIAHAHARHGVDVKPNTAIRAAAVDADHRVTVTTADDESLHSDMVVVGVGVSANDRLARAAGLATDDGIVVDQGCRTSAPAVFAAGDVTRLPGPRGLIRLENWKHALDHGVIAGANAAGGHETYSAIPSFWSEQYDLYVQGVGWPDATGTRVERAISGKSFIVFTIAEDRLVYAMGINAQRDLAMTRRLIERGIPVTAEELTNAGQPLSALLKR